MEIGENLFGYEIVSGSSEYGEIGNNWPAERIEVAEKDGRTKLYQPKQEDKTETADPEQNDTENGAEDNKDNSPDESLDEQASTSATGEAESEEAGPSTVDTSEKVDVPDTDPEPDEDDTLEYTELQETGYTDEEFEELTVNGCSEVVFRALHRYEGQATVDNICNEIFVEKPADHIYDMVRRLLSTYWENVILELPAANDDGQPLYEISDELSIEFTSDSEIVALSQLQENKKDEHLYHCADCGKNFKKKRKAKKHRKKDGHLNWKLRAAPGIMQNWVLKNQEQKQAAGAVQ
jgi:hypothetical protein